MNVNGRRARQMANGYRHLARLGRPIFPGTGSGISTAEAIQRERAKANRQAAAKGKKK